MTALMPDYSHPTQALGMCMIQAVKTSKERGWGLIRVTGRTFGGREHWASIEVNETLMGMRVVDHTLRQFNADAPLPYDGNEGDWLDMMCEYLVDGLDYEIYLTHEPDLDAPEFTDHWSLEEIEPGPMPRPWED
jgi:hypothetical protein